MLQTAAELLSELSRLKQGPGDGFRQAFGKTLRAIRRKKHLAETQKKLESYRDVFTIRILTRLDFRALLHDERFEKLDKASQNLVTALNEGRNTYAKLVAEQTVTLMTHIDRRHDQEASRRLRDDFIKSLLYPEIFVRFDNIARSHNGTCQWFLESPKCKAGTWSPSQASLSDIHQSPPSDIVSSSEESLTNNSCPLNGSTNSRSPSRSDPEDVQYEHCPLIEKAEFRRERPWDSFEEWLVGDGSDPYWLSGKPGSGKSTLMKYISSNFRDYCQNLDSSSPWSNAYNVVTCSFFFWSLGSSIHRSYLGLLKSLLYQIAQKWEDSIPIMAREAKSPKSTMFYEWTEERLEEALRLFLISKPSAMRVCLFIDGLDEFEGDEDKLMATIRHLSQSPGTKVCASSRPEEIFRQGFAGCPHIRLQDLNSPDILKATSDRLTAVLLSRFSSSRSSSVFDSRLYTNVLIRHLTERSQGVFLWAALMTKDIINGARNADSLSELEERLNRTPNTIDGLYMHMLERQDKFYAHEAATYFNYIIEYGRYIRDDGSPTLMHMACSEESAWARIGQRSLNYFLTSDFEETCRNLEIRILSRCAGLVETDEYRGSGTLSLYCSKGFVAIGEHKDCASSCLRGVNSIHKTARDYVRKAFELCSESSCRMTGSLGTVRGQIASAYLLPILWCELGSYQRPMWLSDPEVTRMMTTFWPSTQDSTAMHGAAFDLIDRTYELLFYLNEQLNGPRYEVSKVYRYYIFFDSDLPYRWPSTNCLEFASFFGRWDYTQYSMSDQSNSTQENIERIISSAILGLAKVGEGSRNDHFMNQMNGVSNILLEYLPKSTNTEMLATTMTTKSPVGNHSKWVIFLASMSCLITGVPMRWQYQEYLQEVIHLCKQIIRTFIKHDASANINILLTYAYELGKENKEEWRIRMVLNETLLALVKRRMDWDLGLIEDMKAFLSDFGATDRRLFHGVGYEWKRDDDGVIMEEIPRRLTYTQSERLSHAFPHERLRNYHEWTSDVYESFLGLGTEDAMPTEPNSEAEDFVQLLISRVS